MIARRLTLICLMVTLFGMAFAALVAQSRGHAGNCFFRHHLDCRS